MKNQLTAHCRMAAGVGYPLTAPATPRELLAHLGPFLQVRHTGLDHQDLKPLTRDEAPPRSMSAVTGTDAQPMHTDGAYYPRPPHYIAFHCIEPGEASCPTIVSPLDLARLERDRPKILAAPHWVVRGGGHGRFYCSVLECKSGQARIRFDPLCMYLASCDARQEAQNLLRSYAGRIEFDWESDRLLIIDNWRCLHARGAGADRAVTRQLRRWSIGA